MKKIGITALATVLGAGALLPPAAHAWGQNGHRIVGEIAERHLKPEVAAVVFALLDGESLAMASTWPDEIRSEGGWNCAAPFHYVTVPMDGDYPAGGVAEGDAGQALVYYTDVLTDTWSGRDERVAALKFLVHLVGDLHQPLHVGRGCDRGGNSVSVVWFDEETNLHSVWDTELLESESLSYTEMVGFLDRPGHEAADATIADSPGDWLLDAQSHLPTVYTCDVRNDRCPCFCGGCEDGLSAFGGCETRQCTFIAGGAARLKWQYKARAVPILRSQLLTGGLRLAGLLNWVLAPEPEAPPSFAAFAAKIRALPDWDTAVSACDGGG